jgi:hypothetical protein
LPSLDYLNSAYRRFSITDANSTARRSDGKSLSF